MLFFFYGTLADAERRDAVLDGARGRLVGEAWIHGTLYDLGEYPALVLRGSGRVPGILCDVDGAAARRLDEYEGVHHGLYARRIANVDRGDALAEAWIYEYLGPVDHLSPIERWQVPRAGSHKGR